MTQPRKVNVEVVMELGNLIRRYFVFSCMAVLLITYCLGLGVYFVLNLK